MGMEQIRPPVGARNLPGPPGAMAVQGVAARRLIDRQTMGFRRHRQTAAGDAVGKRHQGIAAAEIGAAGSWPRSVMGVKIGCRAPPTLWSKRATRPPIAATSTIRSPAASVIKVQPASAGGKA